jgi:hypothetical protein
MMEASWNSPAAACIIFARSRQDFFASLNQIVDDGSKLELTSSSMYYLCQVQARFLRQSKSNCRSCKQV